MYHIKTESYHSENPIYKKLEDGDNMLFVPEARVAKDYFNTGIYERGYIQWACENFAIEDKEIIMSQITCIIDIYFIEFYCYR